MPGARGRRRPARPAGARRCCRAQSLPSPLLGGGDATPRPLPERGRGRRNRPRTAFPPPPLSHRRPLRRSGPAGCPDAARFRTRRTGARAGRRRAPDWPAAGAASLRRGGAGREGQLWPARIGARTRDFHASPRRSRSGGRGGGGGAPRRRRSRLAGAPFPGLRRLAAGRSVALIGRQRALAPPTAGAVRRKGKWGDGGGGEDGVPEPAAGVPADPAGQPRLHHRLRAHHRRRGEPRAALSSAPAGAWEAAVRAAGKPRGAGLRGGWRRVGRPPGFREPRRRCRPAGVRGRGCGRLPTAERRTGAGAAVGAAHPGSGSGRRGGQGLR